ncbi:unnamed protein product [Absidia cylindrospora]
MPLDKKYQKGALTSLVGYSNVPSSAVEFLKEFVAGMESDNHDNIEQRKDQQQLAVDIDIASDDLPDP